MKDAVVFVQGRDEDLKYRLEFNSKYTSVTIHSMKKDDNGEFKDTGDTKSLVSEYKFGFSPYELSKALSTKTGNFEMSQTAKDGSVYSFVWNELRGRMDEFKDGKPVDISVMVKSSNVAFRYARQMLQVRAEEPIYSVEDEKYDVMYGVYANESDGKYNVIAYRDTYDGVSVLNGGSVMNVKNAQDAIDIANKFASDETEFDEITDIDLSADDDKMAAVLTIEYKYKGEKNTVSNSYAFSDYCDDAGYDLDFNDFMEDYTNDDPLYRDWENGEYYYVAPNGRRYYPEDEYEDARSEYFDSLYRDIRDGEFVDDNMFDTLYSDIEFPDDIELHPIDWEYLYSYGTSKLEVVPNVLLEKEKEKAIKAISRD